MKTILYLCLLVPALWAETTYWKVQKVKTWDSLNIRKNADHTSEKLGSIPADEQCIINHGCGKDISLDAMMEMEEDAIQRFLQQAKEDWCYIDYKGLKGWVNKRYLAHSQAPCH